MSKSTISTFELFAMFPDQETARVYLEGRLWPEGPKCPVCGLGERITARAGGYFRCNQCKEDFTVRTGTIFERSHVPLHKWIYAMYLLVTARKGISSLQLAKEIGITQKSAWFVLHRLREACGDDLTKLQGIVEIDETYVGGVEKNKHESKKLKAGRGTVGKTAVVAMRERGGKMKAMVVEDADMATLHTKIHQHVAAGSTLHTDEAGVYRGLGGLFFNHETVNHSEGEYARDGVTTNGVESVFAVMKRGLIGVYHHASKKHLGRYVDEFAFRLNDGSVKRHTMDRLESFVSGTKGKAPNLQGADPVRRYCSDCGATNMQVLGFACDHERCPMIVPNNDTLAEMLEGTRDALEKALAKVTKLESANSALANQVLVYARRAEDAIQLRNLLEAVREDNQRLRAELSEIRAQDSDLAERDEPLTPEDRALLDRAWEKHAAAKPVR